MDPLRFDELTAKFARRFTRRDALRSLIAGILDISAFRRVDAEDSLAQTTCGFFETNCGFASVADCVDLSRDDNNCGACGNRCGFDLTCRDGSCTCGGFGSEQTACPSLLGSMTCVDLQADEDNCGWCGNQCGFGLSCNNGVCGCGSGFGFNNTACSNGFGSMICVDLQSDEDHCGSCGNQCDFGLACIVGQCDCRNLLATNNRVTCPDLADLLGRRRICVDLDTDNDHCGACGNQCDFGLSCIVGECGCQNLLTTDNRVPCPDPADLLGSREICVDLNKDNSHCGACENPCDHECNCRSGICECADSGSTSTLNPIPMPAADVFRSEKCDYEIRWDQPWDLASNTSTANWDSITLTAFTLESDQVFVEIWGIPM